MIVLVLMWVAGEGPTIELSHLPRKIVRGRDYPSDAMDIAYHCTRNGRMLRTLGIGKIPSHRQRMSGDIDDIQDHRYRMRRRTFF